MPFSPLACGTRFAQVHACLEPNELLLVYIDDVYLLAWPDRIRFLFDRLSETLAPSVRPPEPRQNAGYRETCAAHCSNPTQPSTR